MKAGDTFVMHSSKIIPDYKEKFNDEKLFPTKEIFNFKHWRDEKVHKNILIEDEDVDNFGNKGFYTLNEDFQMVLLSVIEDPEEQKESLAAIPGIENFEIVSVSN